MTRKLHTILLYAIFLLAPMLVAAQEVIVTVAPTQPVLPPQLLLYITDPGKFFTIQLTNTTSQPQDVHLGLQVEQVMPQGGLSISTPPRRQPQQPFTVPANGQLVLTSIQMQHLFDHIPISEISVPNNLFNNYSNGSFGLLPEGQYQLHVTAYRWNMPALETPMVVSNPNGGIGMFTVCYSAQAPSFLMPMLLGTKEAEVAEVDPFSAIFTWTPPTLACNNRFVNYSYSFRVVEMPAMWSIDEAMDHGPVVYQRSGLVVPQCIIPQNVITNQFRKDARYLAQVTATTTSGNPMDYTLIANSGKSVPRMFRIRTSDEVVEIPELEEPEEPEQPEEPEEEEDPFAILSLQQVGDSIITDSLYTFRNPVIVSPTYYDEQTRMNFMGDDIQVEWQKVWHLGGEGLQPDTLRFQYDVELFDGGKNANRDSTLQTKPLYTHRVVENKDTIRWDSIAAHIEAGHYMVLRIVPHCVNGVGVAFTGGDNVRDFAMVERLSKKYFQCSNMLEIDNETPTTKSAKELEGQVVGIGQYQLTIDRISGSAESGFKGEGRVEWNPLGATIMVCVKFDNLKINTDDIVYSGECKTYAETPESSMEVVDRLFSDWGIDNLIGESGIPYAGALQKSATGAVKDIAKKIDLAKYYKYVKSGKNMKQLVTSGKIERLYMPIALPKDINKSPVDIQVAHMTFAPAYATMDLIGEFTLPGSQYTKNDILCFGAPRLCISPERVLPESGTIALLSDFTIVDPKSTFEMTFKAPENVIEPVDGCYIAWHADTLEILGLHVDMKIPGLVKDINGVASKEKPVLTVKTSISEWDDWMVDNVSIDPFQVETLPGWTFTASNIVYDHSLYRNSAHMGKLPKGYDLVKAHVTRGDLIDWQGLHIGKVGVKFPKALEFGERGDRRLEVYAKDLYYDDSGISLTVGAEDILSAKTGKAGGWAFSLDRAQVNILQDTLQMAQLAGKFEVPLLKGRVGYTCNILKVSSNARQAGQYAYVFKTQQVDNLSLDFFLAKADFEEDQTYFLLEAVPDALGKLDTKVELMLGGTLTIGGKEYLEKQAKQKLDMNFEIPDVHFCGMRVANCPNSWESKFERDLQQKAKNVKLEGKELWKGRDFELASGKVYFSTGRWSFASATKKLGPFEFSLDKYEFDYKNSELSIFLKGSIGLVTGIELSAGAGFTISSEVTLPKDLTDLKSISMGKPKVQFKSADIGMNFAGTHLEGHLDIESEAKDREGFSGNLTIDLPGNVFSLKAYGGYYKLKKESAKYTYGWFYTSVGGKAGIPLDPVRITRLAGGFYYNCRKDGESAIPEEGLIGGVLGLSLSTSAGESTLNGNFDATVIYDRAHNRLSTLLLQGDVHALDDLVNAKANIVYQHDNRDQYFNLDITVDAQADAEELTKKVGDNNVIQSLGDMKKRLNSGYQKIKNTVPMGGLGGAFDDEQSNNVPKSKSGKQGENLNASAGAQIELNLKITMKEKGATLQKTKWHLYIGEPDIDKRCKFTFLKVTSDIVTVDIGANGYICLGNELPNNGKLPDIPQKIRQFLTGSLSESGIQSADVSKAQRAREQALRDFESQVTSIGGGVMFGAQVYGYLDVNLGIFYLNAGVTAGFDMSLVKLGPDVSCTNFPGKPGYKGWYGYGQLYAYLYAKFGLVLDLGFWEGRFDVADAGIGGVFRMQGPRPSHFDGEARVKLRLFNGLVDVNRKFRFGCGQDCDLFMGNALDNFKLFGDLSIGYDNEDAGWAEKNQISPSLLENPILYTEAPLKQPFRVVDETELARLKKNYDGDASNLEMEASRTFVFRSDIESTVTLYEYSRRPDATEQRGGRSSKYTSGRNPLLTVRTFRIKGQNRSALYLDITKLNPNRYYKLTVSGYAKEVIKGVEQDPLKYNARTNKYYNSPWSQTKTYYFATGASQAIPDMPELQDYVAIAYPSYLNKIVRPENKRYIKVHMNDLRRPSISLTTDISKSAYKKGKLFWRAYEYQNKNKLVDQAANTWVTTNNTCIMTPSRALGSFTKDKVYRLTLEYEYSTTDAQKRIITETVRLADMLVSPQESTWRTGFNGKSADYEMPFVGARINSVNQVAPIRYSDYEMLQHKGGKYYNINDPYIYIAFLSNYAFVGGWEFDANRIDVNVTTAQSLVYTDKGGVYEGRLGANENNYNAYNDWQKIRNLSVYDSLQWSRITPYPLPVMEGEYSYALSGLDRANSYIPNKDKYVQVCRCINDMYAVYKACNSFSNTIQQTLKDIDAIDYKNSGKTFTVKANAMEKWYQSRRGQYASTTDGRWLPSGYENFVRLQVPYYQFPLLWGSTLDNSGTAKKLVLWTTLKGYASKCKKYDTARGHRSNSLGVFASLLGADNFNSPILKQFLKYVDFPFDDFKTDAATLNRMRSATFSVYRVNAYDIKNCRYIVQPIGHADPHEERFTLEYPLKHINSK